MVSISWIYCSYNAVDIIQSNTRALTQGKVCKHARTGFWRGSYTNAKQKMKHCQICFQTKEEKPLSTPVQWWVMRRGCSVLSVLKLLPWDSLKPNKRRSHLETKHLEHKDKSVVFFRQKLVNCCAQQCLFAIIVCSGQFSAQLQQSCLPSGTV